MVALEVNINYKLSRPSMMLVNNYFFNFVVILFIIYTSIKDIKLALKISIIYLIIKSVAINNINLEEFTDIPKSKEITDVDLIYEKDKKITVQNLEAKDDKCNINKKFKPFSLYKENYTFSSYNVKDLKKNIPDNMVSTPKKCSMISKIDKECNSNYISWGKKNDKIYCYCKKNQNSPSLKKINNLDATKEKPGIYNTGKYYIKNNAKNCIKHRNDFCSFVSKDCNEWQSKGNNNPLMAKIPRLNKLINEIMQIINNKNVENDNKKTKETGKSKLKNHYDKLDKIFVILDNYIEKYNLISHSSFKNIVNLQYQKDDNIVKNNNYKDGIHNKSRRHIATMYPIIPSISKNIKKNILGDELSDKYKLLNIYPCLYYEKNYFNDLDSIQKQYNLEYSFYLNIFFEIHELKNLIDNLFQNKNSNDWKDNHTKFKKYALRFDVIIDLLKSEFTGLVLFLDNKGNYIFKVNTACNPYKSNYCRVSKAYCEKWKKINELQSKVQVIDKNIKKINDQIKEEEQDFMSSISDKETTNEIDYTPSKKLIIKLNSLISERSNLILDIKRYNI